MYLIIPYNLNDIKRKELHQITFCLRRVIILFIAYLTISFLKDDYPHHYDGRITGLHYNFLYQTTLYYYADFLSPGSIQDAFS